MAARSDRRFPVEKIKQAGAVFPLGPIAGWFVEVRVGQYRVVDSLTQRENDEFFYSGSLTEDEAKSMYRQAIIAIHKKAQGR